MATYYWVGGNGTWSSSATANWSTTSGGAGGAGPVTSADTVYFDANSGGVGTKVTISGLVPVRNVFAINTTGLLPDEWRGVFNTSGAWPGTAIQCHNIFSTNGRLGLAFDTHGFRISLDFKATGTSINGVNNYLSLSTIDSTAKCFEYLAISGGGEVSFSTPVMGIVLQVTSGTVILLQVNTTSNYSLYFTYILVGASLTSIFPTTVWSSSGSASTLFFSGQSSYIFSVKIVFLAYFICDSTWGNISYNTIPNPKAYNAILPYAPTVGSDVYFYGGGKIYPNIGSYYLGTSNKLYIYESNSFYDFNSVVSTNGWYGLEVVFEASTTTTITNASTSNRLGATNISTASFTSNVPGTQANLSTNTSNIRTFKATFKDINATNKTITALISDLNVNSGNNSNIYFGANTGNFLPFLN